MPQRNSPHNSCASVWCGANRFEHAELTWHDPVFKRGECEIWDKNLNMIVDPGEKEVCFGVSDYSNSVFFLNPF
jgi:hypothetical protein